MSSRSRRSARNRGSNEIVAPGGGTQGDLDKLAAQLGTELPVNLVTSVMTCEGRGIKGASSAEDPTGTPSKSTGSVGMPFASPTTTNMWAAFIQEEGVSAMGSGGADTSSGSRPAKRTKTDNNDGTSSSRTNGIRFIYFDQERKVTSIRIVSSIRYT